MHLSVRASERRLASAPERAVRSHGRIEHELNLRRSLSMSHRTSRARLRHWHMSEGGPGGVPHVLAAWAGTRRHPSALMPTKLALCGAVTSEFPLRQPSPRLLLGWPQRSLTIDTTYSGKPKKSRRASRKQKFGPQKQKNNEGLAHLFQISSSIVRSIRFRRPIPDSSSQVSK